MLETSHLEARIGVPNAAAAELRPGTVHPVRIGGREAEAVVRAARPDRDQTTRTVSVIFDIKTHDPCFATGDLAVVELAHEVEQPGYWVPRQSLTESFRGLWAVYVANPVPEDSTGQATHSLALRELEVIHEEAGRAYVRGSLKPDELLVTEGAHRLVPDQAVCVSADPSHDGPWLSMAN